MTAYRIGICSTRCIMDSICHIRPFVILPTRQACDIVTLKLQTHSYVSKACRLEIRIELEVRYETM